MWTKPWYILAWVYFTVVINMAAVTPELIPKVTESLLRLHLHYCSNNCHKSWQYFTLCWKFTYNLSEIGPDKLAKVNSIFLFLSLDLRFHFTVQLHPTIRLHVSKRTYFWNIFPKCSPTNQFKIFPKISLLKSAISTLIFL